MKVLNPVSNADARFYQQQAAELASRDVTVRTLPVPGDYVTNSAESRSVFDYVRQVPQVWAAASEFDIVHANYGLTAPAALAQRSCPVVLSLWGTDLYGQFGWLSRQCARHIDAVVVMSQAMADELDQDCHVVPHGVDLELFSPAPQPDARAELGWDPDRHHVLFPYSTTTELKNYPRAQQVVDDAAKRLDRPVELQIVKGEPHCRMPVYMNAADTGGIAKRHKGGDGLQPACRRDGRGRHRRTTPGRLALARLCVRR